MKNSILLKGLFFSALIFYFKEAEAQLASDTPAQAASKPLVNAKPDSVNAGKGLASDAPVLILSTPKAKKNTPASEKVILPSESMSNKNNTIKSRIKQ